MVGQSLDALTLNMFMISLVFILLIGSMASVSIMQFFQKKKVKGFVYLAIAIIALAVFIMMASGWEAS
ncbi:MULTISPECIES: hypothetical protein [Paenibacillus]|uniref:DUF2768 domain-containing protein n=1 Tax=Paenibacillus lutrae TaxID=2078573 RepID=A0A7X3FMH0_9BACL|nr:MULTISPECIES: hypothetical protein [Paenibacillus]MVP02459.1 hypothetical protein [Paenibacillus lutrae]